MATKMSAHDVTVRYGDAPAIRGVSMEIYERRVTSLIGPSGCGKTTFLRSLNRLNDDVDRARLAGRILAGGTL